MFLWTLKNKIWVCMHIQFKYSDIKTLSKNKTGPPEYRSNSHISTKRALF